MIKITEQTDPGKSCVTCKWFSSYCSEYDNDPLEPTEYGICRNSLVDEFEKDQETVGESSSCKLHELIIQKPSI